MNSPASRFIDRVVDLARLSPEQQPHARQLLSNQIEPASTEDPAWDESAKLLEKRATRGRQWIKWAFIGTCLVVGMIALLSARQSIVSNPLTQISRMSNFSSSQSNDTPAAWNHLSEEKKLILFGDRSKPNAAEQFKALSERFPDNPAYYADYARHHVEVYDRLPENFLETAARIDPGNGWFPLYAAAVTAGDTVKAPSQTQEEKKKHTPKKWKIVDEAKLNKAMALLEQGSRMPEFRSYADALAHERFLLIPPPTDYSTQIASVTYSVFLSSPTLEWQHLVRAIEAKSQHCSARGDHDGFLQLFHGWKNLGNHLLNDSDSLVSVLLTEAWFTSGGQNMKEPAEQLGLHHEASLLKEVETASRTHRDTLKRLGAGRDDISTLIFQRSSMLSSITMPLLLRQTISPPSVTPERLEPVRRTEHGFFGGLLFAGAALMMGSLGLGLFLYRFRHGLVLRPTAKPISTLFSPSDWIWLIGAGTIAPLTFQQVVYHSPWGGSHWSIGSPIPLGLTSAQLMSWILLTIAMPIIIVRWRLGRRLRNFKPDVRGRRSGWSVPLLAIASTAISVVLRATSSLPAPLAIALALVTCSAQIWILIWIFRALLSSGPRSFARQIKARLLIPAYAASFLLIAGMVPYFHAQERHWVKYDTILGGDSRGIGMGEFEREVALARKAEVRELVAPLYDEDHP